MWRIENESDPHSHFNQCKKHVLSYALSLFNDKKMTVDRAEGYIKSYLKAPAFADNQQYFLDFAMTELKSIHG
jgi:hypothetical protein